MPISEPQGPPFALIELTALYAPISIAQYLPTIKDASGGTNSARCVVTLQCAQVVDSNNKGNVAIRYTTDGTDPTADHGMELNPGQSVKLIYGLLALKVIQAGVDHNTSSSSSSGSSSATGARINVLIEPYKRFNT